jgi:hypothetical protein
MTWWRRTRRPRRRTLEAILEPCEPETLEALELARAVSDELLRLRHHHRALLERLDHVEALALALRVRLGEPGQLPLE